MIWFFAAILLMVLAGFLYYALFYDRSTVYDKALRLAEHGDFTDARGLIRSRVEREPDNPYPHSVMVHIYEMEGNEEGELIHLQELKKINRSLPDYPLGKVYNRIAAIHYRRDEFLEAYAAYQEALEITPRSEEALTHLGFMAIGQGEFNTAEKYLSKLIQVSPNHAEYRLARGVALSMLKRSEAIEELEKAHALNSSSQVIRFILAFQLYREKKYKKAYEVLSSLLPELEDVSIRYFGEKLATTLAYHNGMYVEAYKHSRECMIRAQNENWSKEEYDSRLAFAYMSILTGNLEDANENLLELELQNPQDQNVMKVSDFRMDLEEGVAEVGHVSPRGFDFHLHLEDWARGRFPEDTIYRISGLMMAEQFELPNESSDAPVKRKVSSGERQIDPEPFIDAFNELKEDEFQKACASIIEALGCKLRRTLPYKEKDGMDMIAVSQEDKKKTVLFRIRKWKNQPISDIFLRDMQNYMNELKVNEGFVVAGASLTAGAESALENLKKIQVVNEVELGELLQKIMK